MNTIIGIYKITNTVTGDFYIGSSKDVKRRWKEHKYPSIWNKQPNNPMYLDMKNYGTDKFVFEILEEVEIDKLKVTEQKFIELLKPTYNSNNANGLNIERRKEAQKKYNKSDKGKEAHKEAQKKYRKTDKGKEAQKEYKKTDKYKEAKKKAKKKYRNQLCCYNGETLTLRALYTRFKRKGLSNPTQEAKKYLI